MSLTDILSKRIRPGIIGAGKDALLLYFLLQALRIVNATSKQLTIDNSSDPASNDIKAAIDDNGMLNSLWSQIYRMIEISTSGDKNAIEKLWELSDLSQVEQELAMSLAAKLSNVFRRLVSYNKPDQKQRKLAIMFMSNAASFVLGLLSAEIVTNMYNLLTDRLARKIAVLDMLPVAHCEYSVFAAVSNILHYGKQLPSATVSALHDIESASNLAKSAIANLVMLPEVVWNKITMQTLGLFLELLSGPNNILPHEVSGVLSVVHMMLAPTKNKSAGNEEEIKAAGDKKEEIKYFYQKIYSWVMDLVYMVTPERVFNGFINSQAGLPLSNETIRFEAKDRWYSSPITSLLYSNMYKAPLLWFAAMGSFFTFDAYAQEKKFNVARVNARVKLLIKELSQENKLHKDKFNIDIQNICQADQDQLFEKQYELALCLKKLSKNHSEEYNEIIMQAVKLIKTDQLRVYLVAYKDAVKKVGKGSQEETTIQKKLLEIKQKLALLCKALVDISRNESNKNAIMLCAIKYLGGVKPQAREQELNKLKEISATECKMAYGEDTYNGLLAARLSALNTALIAQANTAAAKAAYRTAKHKALSRLPEANRPSIKYHQRVIKALGYFLDANAQYTAKKKI